MMHDKLLRAFFAVSLGMGVWNSRFIAAQGYAPEEAVRHMSVAGGFEVSLVASEPLIRQPVCIEFDDRGRLWVIQYLQYPNPEGLKRVAVDRYSRTEYDRVPLPPPQGPRGADRITILEDTDGDGRMDHGRDFVDGLNLASGMAFGHGGVFVLNVPYLLFYPDRDRDDVPDGDPQVLLSGFGMQDAHSVANSLTWGPDGWLYGCQGSTVTANVRGIEFQQGVWRYHPRTRQFELFCEGGGNCWGLDFDARGNLLYSTNYGGFVLVHGVQGGYFVKSFGKHGALHNPFAYGYFDHAPHTGFQGGHVTVGGLVYQGESFPDAFRGKYIAGDLLGHGIYWHDITQRGSTVATAHGGTLLQANDEWFAPTDLTIGPEGAIYVADWHDARTAHPDPDADWDRTNGRIYRIAAVNTPAPPPVDFSTLSLEELLALHEHAGQWNVRRARQELARRADQASVIRLREALDDTADEQTSIERFWTLMTIDGVDEPLAERLLDSPNPALRYWSLRWLGDAGGVSDSMAHRLDELAEQEPDVRVRQQLACTAARLPAAQALPVINANILRDIDNDDPYLPLLWWWAIERHSVSGRDEVLRRFTRRSAWTSILGREFLLPRLVRRYAAEGTRGGYDAVVTLLQAAPQEEQADPLWESVLFGLQQGPSKGIAQICGAGRDHELARAALEAWRQDPDAIVRQRLAILLGHPQPLASALADARDPRTPEERRIELLQSVALCPQPSQVEPLLSLLDSDGGEKVRLAALDALGRIESSEIADPLISLSESAVSADLKSRIRDVLLGRRAWALEWLRAVDRGAVDPGDVSIEQVRQVALFDDADIDALLLKHWGRLDAASREDKLAEVRRLNNDLRAGPGEARAGREVFRQRCAACHQLFGEGQKVGPDLTSANRSDRQALLVSLVDPSSVIRKEYVSVVVQTTDGRVLTGLPRQRDNGGIALVDSKGQETALAAGEIEQSVDSDVSLMPEDLYRQLTPQQLRDLFAYLQAPAPPE